jgi:hypothetical protein
MKFWNIIKLNKGVNYMLRNKWLFIVLSFIFLVSFPLATLASDFQKVVVELPGGIHSGFSSGVSSKYINVSESDVLIWRVENTSKNKNLYYNITPRPFGWCGTVAPIDSGTLQPGERVSKSTLGKDFSGEYRIYISGDSGRAEMSAR